MIDLILNEPQLLFSLALTAKTCLVTLALFLVAGPLAGYYLARAPGVALYITHAADEAERLAKTVLTMKDGRIADIRTPA